MMHLKNLIATTPIPGSDGWHTAVLEVTPETADDLLANNAGNRRLSPGAVARYAAAMRKGDWQTSPEPLIFAPNGRLMNGQTRLHAIKATGTPQKFMCVFGVDEKVFSVLDRGRPRSLADAHGVKDRKRAEVARRLTETAYGKKGGIVADSDFVKVLGVIEESHALLVAASGSNRSVFSSAPVRAGAVARLLAGEPAEFVLSTYAGLVLADLDTLPPAGKAAIRLRINGTLRSGLGAAASDALLARAWDMFRADGAARKRVLTPDTTQALADIGRVVRQAVEDAANV